MRPYFPAAAATAPPGPRLLLISYHFPPSQAAGALRWQKLAALAAEHGLGLDVIAADPATLKAPDWQRLEELPRGTRIYGVRRPVLVLERLEALAVAALRSLRRGRAAPTRSTAPASAAEGAGGPLVVPREVLRWRLTAPGDYLRAFEAWMYFARDAAWNAPAAAAARAIVRPGVHQAVISCGPPHMAHRAGWQVARRAGLPFIMDMRDPWSQARALLAHFASPLWLRLAARHEREAVRRAALVVTNTEAMGVAMQQAYPAAGDRVITVMNGYDEESIPKVPRGARFSIAYAGSIYLDRDPRVLLRAAGRFVRELHLRPEQFGIDLIGNVERFGDLSVAALARDAGLDGFVHLGPPRPRQAMMEFLAGASMLLSLPQDLPLAIPSKLFEYMQIDAWLLVLAKRDSATERLLRGSGADVVEPDDEDRLTAVLHQRYAEFVRGERPAPLAAGGRFSRRAQAEVLFTAIDRVVERRS